MFYVLFSMHIIFPHEKNVERKKKMIRDHLQRRGENRLRSQLDEELDIKAGTVEIGDIF